MDLRHTCLLLLLAGTAPALAGEQRWLAAQFTRVQGSDFGIGDEGRIDAVEHRLSGELPVGGSRDEPVTLGLDYVYTRYEYAGLNGRNRDLHRLELPLTRHWSAGSWRIAATAAPGISASSNVFKEPGERWSRDELTLRAAFAARYAPPGNWSWRVGLVRDQRLGSPRVYPAAAAILAGRVATLELGWPVTRVAWRAGPGQRVTASLCAAGHRWRVVSDEIGAAFDYRVRAGRATVAWEVDLADSLALEIGGGYEFSRRHWLTDDSGARLSADAGGSWLLTVGLRTGRRALPATRVSPPAECR